jgi:hypothetical protein
MGTAQGAATPRTWQQPGVGTINIGSENEPEWIMLPKGLWMPVWVMLPNISYLADWIVEVGNYGPLIFSNRVPDSTCSLSTPPCKNSTTTWFKESQRMKVFQSTAMP